VYDRLLENIMLPFASALNGSLVPVTAPESCVN
jgi:hypothetical protein